MEILTPVHDASMHDLSVAGPQRIGEMEPGSSLQVPGQLSVSSYCCEVWCDEVSLGPNYALRRL